MQLQSVSTCLDELLGGLLGEAGLALGVEADVLGNALGPLLHLLLVPAGYVQAQLGGRVCNRDQQVLAVWSA